MCGGGGDTVFERKHSQPYKKRTHTHTHTAGLHGSQLFRVAEPRWYTRVPFARLSGVLNLENGQTWNITISVMNPNKHKGQNIFFEKIKADRSELNLLTKLLFRRFYLEHPSTGTRDVNMVLNVHRNH